MKKIIMTLALCFGIMSVSAQDFAIGGRLGSGLQLQAELGTSNNSYAEARFGMSWCAAGAPIMADLTLLHQWNIVNFSLTPRAGDWFLDGGAGVGVGGKAHYAYVGIAGSLKVGIKFHKAPIKLALDWTPLFGPEIGYANGNSAASFHGYGLANLGVSCVYCF